PVNGRNVASSRHGTGDRLLNPYLTLVPAGESVAFATRGAVRREGRVSRSAGGPRHGAPLRPDGRPRHHRGRERRRRLRRAPTGADLRVGRVGTAPGSVGSTEKWGSAGRSGPCRVAGGKSGSQASRCPRCNQRERRDDAGAAAEAPGLL